MNGYLLIHLYTKINLPIKIRASIAYLVAVDLQEKLDNGIENMVGISEDDQGVSYLTGDYFTKKHDRVQDDYGIQFEDV